MVSFEHGYFILICRSFNPFLFDFFIHDFAKSCRREISGYFIGPVLLPKKVTKFSILSSPFKHKDSRDQLEIREFKGLFFLHESKIKEALLFIKLYYTNSLNILNTSLRNNIKANKKLDLQLELVKL